MSAINFSCGDQHPRLWVVFIDSALKRFLHLTPTIFVSSGHPLREVLELVYPHKLTSLGDTHVYIDAAIATAPIDSLSDETILRIVGDQ